jgi:hypothetical protein
VANFEQIKFVVANGANVFMKIHMTPEREWTHINGKRASEIPCSLDANEKQHHKICVYLRNEENKRIFIPFIHAFMLPTDIFMLIHSYL